jgi:serine/threonine protein kinase
VSLTAGTKLGRYEIRSKIGAGGMGEVYLAQDSKLDRKVALKVLPAEVAAHPDRMKRFVQEAKAASALNHPNIITIYEIDETDSVSFIATEFIDGATLRERIRGGRAKVSEAIDIAVQAASALAAAHAAGILHRDIKPENVILRNDGIVKVLDFGLAKLAQSQPAIDAEAATRPLVKTEPGRVMGTIGYMSPEQMRGLDIDARTDIWSLGVVLYEMLAGQAPFAGETSSHIGVSILEIDPAPVAQYAPQAPAELQRIVRKALAKDREDRYQTVRDLLIDLKNLRRELELRSEIERSLPPGVETAKAGDAQAAQVTKSTSLSQPAAVLERRPTSSAEYLITEIKRHRRGVIIGLIALIAIAAIITTAVVLILQRPQAEQTKQRALARLTFDTGLQSEPTWSPDGRFIAYSSDRGGNNFDIWVQPVTGGNPIQLTKSPAHDWQPDWSPDGNRMVFRSERDGGGLFVMPAPTGGDERKISSFGYSPHWSPDGSQILFFSSNNRNSTSPPKVFVTGLDGSPPHQVLSQLLAEFVGRWEINWHPDGQRVSIWGDRGNQERVFWTVPVNGGTIAKSEVSAEVEKRRLEAGVDLAAFRWSPSGRALYFDGTSQGVENLWKVEVDPQTLRWVAGPERLTVGAGADTDVALSHDGKKLAFVTRTERTRIWLLPFNSAKGQITGEGQPVTSPTVNAYAPDLSSDGKKMVYVARRSGKQELWAKSLEDGSEKLLASSDKLQFFVPTWSPDGSLVSYARDRSGSPERTGYQHVSEHSIAFVSADGGEEHAVTSLHQLQGYPWDWTKDQQWILGSSARQLTNHWGLYLFPIAAAPNAENQMRLITERPGYEVYHARFSPDRLWISFRTISTTDAGEGHVYVVPATGGEWRGISEGKDWSAGPMWAPDGRTIYFLSDRAGFLNVWGRRFDPVSGQPVGEAFRVTRFESPGQMISRGGRVSCAADRLVLPIAEVSGSIWILENVDH